MVFPDAYCTQALSANGAGLRLLGEKGLARERPSVEITLAKPRNSIRQKSSGKRIYNTLTMEKIKKSEVACRAVAVIVLFIIIAVSVTSCAADNGIADESGNMKIDFGEDGAIRNGTEYYTYRVEEGYKGIVSVTISKKSGRLDLDIYPTDRKEDKEYSGRDLDSASFSVILSESGEYKVRVTAKDFVGSYELSLKTEKTEKE